MLARCSNSLSPTATRNLSKLLEKTKKKQKQLEKIIKIKFGANAKKMPATNYDKNLRQGKCQLN